jgi:ribose transport system substrate-binding protein
MLVLSGCAVKATPVATPVSAERTGTYYFLAANNADPFYIPGVKGLTEAGEMVGMKTEFVGPMDLNVASQLKTFEELIVSPNTKGILWYPSDFAAGEDLITAAHAKGIPVIIGALDSPYKGRDAFVGYDNTVLGTQAGAWAAKLIDCKGTVGTVGIQSGPNVPERIAGFEAYIASVCPEVTIIPQVTHDGSAANEAATLEAYLIANPNLTLLWWADGAAGLQAQIWKEKQELGIKTMFLATDMPPATLQAVKDGVFVGSVGQDTYTEEFISIVMLDLLSKGYRVPDTMYLSAILVDKSNVDLYIEP